MRNPENKISIPSVLIKCFFNFSINERDLNDLNHFLRPEYSSMSFKDIIVFFKIIKKAFPLILSVYNRERRKVNDGLYIRHVLKTVLVSYQLMKSLDLDKQNKERVVLSALFHDAFEMNFDYNEERLKKELEQVFPEKERDWLNLICADVRSLTPPKKDPNLDYIERKKSDFERFVPKDENREDKPFVEWKEDEKIRFIIKAADVYANLYETVDDLNRGLDDKLMNKSLGERVQVFEERVRRIQKILSFSPFVGKFETLLSEVKGHCQ